MLQYLNLNSFEKVKKKNPNIHRNKNSEKKNEDEFITVRFYGGCFVIFQNHPFSLSLSLSIHGKLYIKIVPRPSISLFSPLGHIY